MVFKMSDINRNSLYDRVNKLLVSYEWSDCSFSVSGRKFKAHKLILGISSPVFEAMFYGPMSSTDDIGITDIEPNIFQLLLNYIYTDKVEISSIEEAYELLYVSRKYLLDYLSEICIYYIQSHITIDNVIRILNYPDYMQDNQLVNSSLTLLCEHAKYVLLENLQNISMSCMQKILQCENMNISEKELIKNVFTWTAYQCEKRNENTDLKTRRSIVIEHNLLKMLRFAVLSTCELNEILSDKNNLLLQCESDIIKHYIKDKTVRPPVDLFSTITVPRNEIQLHWKLCHRSSLRSIPPATIDNYNNSIQTRVKVNKSVFINSLRVLSRMAPAINFYSNATKVYCEQFNVVVVDENDTSINQKISIKKEFEYDSNLDVEFKPALFFKKDNWYHINFIWPEITFDSYLYAIQSRENRFSTNNIEFQFEDLSCTSDNGGSFLKGLTYCM